MITSLDHIQLAMPRGGENAARRFYAGVLGFTEVDKPAHLAARGGCWFQSGSVKVHLGIEDDFRAARKAHPAFLVADLATTINRLKDAGIAIVTDEPLPDYDGVYVSDPFGNRIELLSRIRRLS
jgi:catechol 2,3-dioxygenase-like lactoylglutathione lyase family enzyme